MEMRCASSQKLSCELLYYILVAKVCETREEASSGIDRHWRRSWRFADSLRSNAGRARLFVRSDITGSQTCFQKEGLTDHTVSRIRLITVMRQAPYSTIAVGTPMFPRWCRTLLYCWVQSLKGTAWLGTCDSLRVMHVCGMMSYASAA